MMLRRPCGCDCPEPCPSYGDNFDDETIGVEWTEVSGSFSESGTLLTTSDTNALLITDGGGVIEALGSAFMRVPYGGVTRKFVRLAGAYIDADTFLFVDFEFDFEETDLGSFPYTRLHLYERVGGVDTLLESSHAAYSSAFPVLVQLCWNGRAAAAYATSPGYPESISATGPCTLTGNKAGVGSGSVAESIFIDSFAMAPLSSDGELNVLCGGCPSCRDICVVTPESIVVVAPERWINGTCANCTSINGKRFVLDRQTDFQEQLPSPLDSVFQGEAWGSCVYRHFEELGCGFWLQVTAWPAWWLMFALREGGPDGLIRGVVVYKSASNPDLGQNCCPKDWELAFVARFGTAMFGLCEFDDDDPPPITITTDCYYDPGGGGDDTCCLDVDLPDSLFATGLGQTDLELTKAGQDETSYFFSTTVAEGEGFATYTLSCAVDDDPPGKTIYSKVGPGVGEGSEVVLTVHSCNPYHATGTGVEITE